MTKPEREPCVVQILIGEITLAEAERLIIRVTLLETGGNCRAAARLLGVCAHTVYNKLARWRREDAAAGSGVRMDGVIGRP